jgi:hypothetical protein
MYTCARGHRSDQWLIQSQRCLGEVCDIRAMHLTYATAGLIYGRCMALRMHLRSLSQPLDPALDLEYQNT